MTKIRTMSLLMISFVCTLSGAYGETLRLDKVLESVDQNYPLILGARQDVAKSEADHLSASGGFDPVLKAKAIDNSLGYYNYTHYDISVEQPTALWGTKVFAGYRKGIGNFPIYDSKLQTFDQGEILTGIEVPLLKDGWVDNRRTRIRSTEAGIKAAEQNLSSKILEVKRDAARKYWDWVSAGMKLKVAEELLDIALVRDRALLSRVKKGDAAQIDHTDNQRAVVQRQAGIISAQRSLQKSTLELSIYYRDFEGRPILPSVKELPEQFPELDPHRTDGLPRSILDTEPFVLNHPDIRTLGHQLEQLDLERSLARNQVLPQLDFRFTFVKDLGVNPGNASIPPSNYPHEFRIGLNFEFPLLVRSARGKLASITATQLKMSLQQDLTRDRLKTQIVDSSQAMSAAIERVDFTHREVELSKKLEDAERIRFQHGDSSLLIINIREQTTRDAMNKEIEAQAEFFKSLIDYKTYTATLGLESKTN